MSDREFTVQISQEDDMYWGEVVELPGVFASGATWEELSEALGEAIEMVLEDEPAAHLTFPKSPPMPAQQLRPTTAALTLCG